MSRSDSRSRSPDGEAFLVLHPFMWHDIGLRGAELLVFARIYGFCKNGGLFYESRAGTASYLGLSERSVTRAIGALVDRGVLIDLDPTVSMDGISTRTYMLPEGILRAFPRSAPDKMSPPDNMTAETDGTGEPMSGEGVPDWHLKSKSESNL